MPKTHNEHTPGRPHGTTEYSEKKTGRTHIFTSIAHAWLRIKENKKLIENLSRKENANEHTI